MPHLRMETLENRRLFASVPLDTAFAGGGVATVSFKNVTSAITDTQAVLATGDASYVKARVGNSVQVRRLTAAGAVDTGFAARKKNILVLPLKSTGDVNKIETDAAGRLLVLTGRTISRFTANGEADASFGTNGSVTLTDFTQVRDFDADATNKIYVTGDTSAGTNVVVGRLISRGKYDKTFDGDGRLALPQPKSSIPLTERTGQGRLVRVLDNGTADASDDTVVVAGIVVGRNQNNRYYSGTESARLTGAGTLVAAYGRGGLASVYGSGSTSDADSGDSSYNNIGPSAVLPNGSVVLLGTSRSQFGGDSDFDQYDALFDANGTRRTFAYRVNGQSSATVDRGYVVSELGGVRVFDASNASPGLLAGTVSTRVGYVTSADHVVLTGLTRGGQRLNVVKFLPSILDF